MDILCLAFELSLPKFYPWHYQGAMKSNWSVGEGKGDKSVRQQGDLGIENKLGTNSINYISVKTVL